MQQNETSASVFKYVDWFTVVLYIILVGLGMVSIYAAGTVYALANSGAFA